MCVCVCLHDPLLEYNDSKSSLISSFDESLSSVDMSNDFCVLLVIYVFDSVRRSKPSGCIYTFIHMDTCISVCTRHPA